MNDSTFNIKPQRERPLKWLNRQFLGDKMRKPWGYVLFLTIAGIAVGMITTLDVNTAFYVLLGLLSFPLIMVSLANARFGLMLVTLISFFVLGIKRFTGDLPLGIALDVMTGVLVLGTLIKHLRERDFQFLRHPLSYILAIWIAYSVLLVLNPYASSRLGWVSAVRTLALQGLLFYVALSAIDSFKFIRQYSLLLVGLLGLAALYGLFQELIGIPSHEMDWLYSDYEKYQLYFLNGRFRVFSFFSDPAIFGVMMAVGALMCMTLTFGPWDNKYRIGFGVLAFLMVCAMLPSGTRTAYVVVPVGLFFLTFLTLQRRVLLVTAILFVLGGGFIASQWNSPMGERISSAFRPMADESYRGRLENQRFIQHFVRTHPVGAGLGTSGERGKKYAPDTMLANFPTDGGYLMVAVEMGWVGLLLYCVLLFIALRTGVTGYFWVQSQALKNVYAAYSVLLLGLIVANFTQLTLTQRPATEVFFILLAILVKLRYFEEEVFLERLQD